MAARPRERGICRCCYRCHCFCQSILLLWLLLLLLLLLVLLLLLAALLSLRLLFQPAAAQPAAAQPAAAVSAAGAAVSTCALLSLRGCCFSLLPRSRPSQPVYLTHRPSTLR